VNLLTLLLTYQNTTVGSDTRGAFSPVPSSTLYAVRTTSWALLAMDNLGLSQNDARVKLAEQWLAAQQDATAGGDGGFPSDAVGGQSDALDTALAVQALKATSDGQDWGAAAARAFLKSSQKPTGGFPSDSHGNTNGEATSAAIQAILALGERPEDPGWTVVAGTPIDALARLQKRSGAYKLTSAQNLRSVTVTSWALVALRRRPFTSFPRNIGPADTAFRFRPRFASVSPKNGTKYTHSRTVSIHATYTDHYPKGTGIKPGDCRVYVDNADRTRAADIGTHGLRLQLKNVPNGRSEERRVGKEC
jgi:hypothetical protein